MPLSAADRAFLSQQWRFVEGQDTTLRNRYPGAREAEYASPLVTLDGATTAMNIMHAAVTDKGQVIVASIIGVIDVSFKGRPRTVRVYHDRFGGDPIAGRLMMCERAVKDWAADRTTLFLIG